MGGQQWWREGYACDCLITVVEKMVEPRMIAAGDIHSSIEIYQQSYNSSVSASAGTHSGGGAIDTQRYDTGAQTIWRESGVAYWPRGDDKYNDGMDPHAHGIVIGCPHLSADAEDQVNDYRNGRNGLANNGPDNGPDVPYITWQDALAQYEQTEGLWGMSSIRKFSRYDDQKFTGNGEWQTLRINDEGDMSFLSGPSDGYLIISCYAWAGLEPGDALQLRFVLINDYTDTRDTVIEQTYPTQESVATAGNSYGQITWGNNLGGDTGGAKRKIRLQVCPPDGKTVTVLNLISRVFL